MTLLTTDRFVIQRDTSTGAARPVTYQAIVVDPSMESNFFDWFEGRNWFNTGRSPGTYNIGEQTDTDSIPDNSCWIYDFGEPGVQWGYDSLSDIQVTGFGRQYFWTSDDGVTFEPFDPPLQKNPDGEDGGYRNYVNFRVPTRYFKFMGDNKYEGMHVFGKSWLDQGVVVPNSYQLITYENISFEAFEALNWTGSSDWWWVGGYPEGVIAEGCIYDLGQAGCMWGYLNTSTVPSILDLIAFVSDDGVSWREQVIPDLSYTPQFVVEGRYLKLFDRSGGFGPREAFPRYYITDQDYQSKALYSIQSEKLVATLEDSDLMVVGRGSTPYKITGKEVKDSLGGGGGGGIFPSDNDLTINPSVPGSGTLEDPYILATRTAAPAGSTVSTSETITFTEQPPNTDVIWTDNSTGSGTRFSQPVTKTDANGTWSAELQYADAPDSTEDIDYTGNLQIGVLHFRWQVDQKLNDRIPTEVDSVNLVDTGLEDGPRFTDQSFVFTSVVTDGAPLPTKTIEAHVDGSIRITPESSDIVGVGTGVITAPYTDLVVPALASWEYGVPANLFDGSTSTEYGVDGSTAGGAGSFRIDFRYDPAFQDGTHFGSSVQVYWGAATSGNSQGFQVNYLDGTQDEALNGTAGGTSLISLQSKPVKNFKFRDTGNAPYDISITKIEIGGVALTGSYDVGVGTELTLANDDGLSSFAAGDAVVQDSGFGAVTSEIVGVGSAINDGSIWKPGVVSRDPIYSGSWDKVFSAGDTDRMEMRGNYQETFFHPTNSIAVTSVSVKGRANDVTGGRFWVFWYKEGSSGDTSADWLAVGNERDPAKLSYEFDEPKVIEHLEFQSGAGDSEVILDQVIFDGVPFGGSFPVLTLADNKDLDKFVALDLVQQDSSITAPAPAMSTTLWTGNKPNGQAIVSGVDNTGKSMVWIKNRDDSGQDHVLVDTVRPQSYFLSSNTTVGESSSPNRFEKFTPDGFIVGTDTGTNGTDNTIVGWNFRAAPKFFDVVYYLGSSSPQSIAHNLGSKPGFIIIKCTNYASNWQVYHTSTGNEKALMLNAENAAGGTVTWNDTDPTTTEFTVGTDNTVNGVDRGFIAYLFADDEPGLIKCGSYTGKSTLNNIIVGFAPQWVLIKCTSSSGRWMLFDDKRDSLVLNPNNSNSESSKDFQLVDDGFFISAGNQSDTNIDGEEYIYVAIAEDAMTDLTTTPSGLFQSTDGNTITLTPQTDGWQANQGTKALGPTTTASGTVSSIDGSTMNIAGSEGTWTPNADKYVVGPEKIVSNARQYLKFDSSGNVTDMQSRPQDPPYTTTTTNPSLTLTFPSTFPSGETPDDELPEGTTLSVGIASENVVNRSPVTGYEEAIVQPKVPVSTSDLFATMLYAGDGLTRTIINGINLYSGPGLVWTKSTNGGGEGYDNILNTTVFPGAALSSNTTASLDYAYSDTVTLYNGDGYNLGGNLGVNGGTADYVSWSFKAAPKFFDVQTWVGTDNAPRNIPHDLETIPGLILVKEANEAGNWRVYSKTLGADYRLILNSAGAAEPGTTYWGNTEPTDTVFTVGQGTNGNGFDLVAYLFADDTPGLIKCGSYTGAGDQLVDVGFEPQWVLLKNTSKDGEDWLIFDSERAGKALLPNTDSSGSSWTGNFTLTSNGFQLAGGPYLALNYPGDTYIYVAIAAPVVETMTAEQFTESQLKFLTYDNRKQVKEGEDALNNREKLFKEAADLGLTQDQITNLLNE